MGKKLESTPRSRVRSAIRQVFLRSRERAACLKAAGNKCVCCGVKASKAKGREQKVEVHHAEGIGNWEKVIDLVYEEILCHPSKLACLCPECHRAAGDPALTEVEPRAIQTKSLLEIIEKWNEGADEYNCWDELSEGEKAEFAYELGVKSAKEGV